MRVSRFVHLSFRWRSLTRLVSFPFRSHLAVIKGWRKDYVKNMIQQGNVAKEKHKEKSARDAAVGMLQGIPVGGGELDDDAVEREIEEKGN